jgi:putative ABC transport system ATP-binding protein
MEDSEAPVALETPPLYRLRGVERHYMKGASEVAAVSGVDLDIAAGGFICIEGPSGSGKSTLLQLLGALDTPTAGTIQMDNKELGTASDHVLTEIRSKRIGFVFQHFNLIPTLSALENVALAMAPHHESRAKHDERAKQLLTRVGLGHRLEHLPSRLSGGEQQRVAIARALANRPDVIMADEPTGNLDSESAAEVLSLLVELQERDGVTVIVATHDPEVAQLASRRISLRDGAVVEDDSHQSPQHPPRHVMLRDGAVVEDDSPQHPPRHVKLRDGAMVEDDSHQSPQHASPAKHAEASDNNPAADGQPTG